MKWVYRMMPELADHIPWAQDYDIGVKIDWDEDMDEEVMQRETWNFYCPTAGNIIAKGLPFVDIPSRVSLQSDLWV